MQQTSVFSLISKFVPEQSEPLDYFEFQKETVIQRQQTDTQRKQNNLRKTSSNERKNPYRSSWAQTILHQQFNLEILEKGNKFILKKLPEHEGNSTTLQSPLPPLQNSQRKKYFESISNNSQNNLKRFFQQKRRYHISTSTENNSYNMHNTSFKKQEQNDVVQIMEKLKQSRERLMPIFDVNFRKNLTQYNL